MPLLLLRSSAVAPPPPPPEALPFAPVEPSTAPPTLVPLTDVPLDEEDAFDALQRQLDPDAPADLVVATEPPKPIGRSWAYDFPQRQWIQPVGGRGPKPTGGLETLSYWIEKALRTARGAHPVHPPGYGLEDVEPLIGANVGTIPPDLETKVRDALKFHPRISDVGDFEYNFLDDEDWLEVAFTVILDDDTLLPVSGLRLVLVP